jgi:glycine cleavage system regulatory protein
MFLVLTVLGDDRPGLVESIAQVIAIYDGNWLESRMARLAGKFAGILRASVPDANVTALTTALQRLEVHGLRVMIDWSASDALAQDYRHMTLNVLGTDRVGIIRDIAQSLAWRGINIDELHTEYTSAPMSGEMLFKATAHLRVPLQVMSADLQESLEKLAHDLMVDITLADLSAQTPE